MKCLVGLVIVVMFAGCAARVEYVDRPVEVKVPVACEVPMPKSPIVGQDVDGLREILKYTELLECGLMACRGEPCK